MIGMQNMKHLLQWSYLVLQSISTFYNRLLAEDAEYGLFAVVVFKKVMDEYCSKLRLEKYFVFLIIRFIPRDFIYDEERIKNEQVEASQLGRTAKEQSVI